MLCKVCHWIFKLFEACEREGEGRWKMEGWFEWFEFGRGKGRLTEAVKRMDVRQGVI